MTAAAFAELAEERKQWRARGVEFTLGKSGWVLWNTSPACMVPEPEILAFRDAHQVDLAVLLTAGDDDQILKRFGFNRWLVESGTMSHEVKR